jgi:hypothetical protein
MLDRTGNRAAVRFAPHGLLVAGLVLAATACGSHLADGGFDVLQCLPPPPTQALDSGQPIDKADYPIWVQWGANWFRDETFGDERTVTDIVGLMGGTVDVPCEHGPPGCVHHQPVFPLFVKALDDLDDKPGNLFDPKSPNGGPDGKGFTSDLVIRFPPGSRLFGAIPVPTELHTGLDVEAGASWPLGIVPIDAPDADQSLGYLPRQSDLGAGPGSTRRFRLGLTCALCHYSLDIDGDGTPDIHSVHFDRRTAGPYQPEDGWAVGNQNLHFGWLFGLAANPLLGLTVLSGPIGTNQPRDAMALVTWIRDNYVRAPETVQRQVVQGMLLQPRGYPDDTADALHDPVQLPSIFTQRNWPYNYDGALENASDRNNSVWTGALDFTGLIGLCSDRGTSGRWPLWWERSSVYSLLSSGTYADMMTRYSPAVRWNPAVQQQWVDDILGVSDGVPGLLDPDSVVVMKGVAMPDDIYDHPANASRRRQASDFGLDGPPRSGTLALLGTRVRTPTAIRKAIGLDAIATHYGLGKVDQDEFFTNVISLMLDWQKPPPNLSPLLAHQWPLVERGYRVFQEEHCDTCHRGAFLTDNRINRLSARQQDEFGISTPSTAGWLFRGRDLGPPIGTDSHRAIGSRPQELFISPGFDPSTGRATSGGSVLAGLFGDRRVGYKTVTLRNLWATPPYLHDGGVGVSFPPADAPPGELHARLRAAATDPSVRYGMGVLLDAVEQGEPWRRPDAALSLQALLLEHERARVVAANRSLTMHVRGRPPWDARGNDPAEVVSMASLGVSGVGHEYFIRDEPGGERITALVAFLLALDDKPCELPGEPSHCRP